jgi:hypothetical protein
LRRAVEPEKVENTLVHILGAEVVFQVDVQPQVFDFQQVEEAGIPLHGKLHARQIVEMGGANIQGKGGAQVGGVVGDKDRGLRPKDGNAIQEKYCEQGVSGRFHIMGLWNKSGTVAIPGRKVQKFEEKGKQLI